jgi:hypothetical protein
VLPFERLRALARHDGDDTALVVEAADCLADFAGDPTQLVTVCRRLLAHHLECGPLWWLCARVVGAPDPGGAAQSALRALQSDRTAPRLAAALPFPHDEPIAVVGWPEFAARALAERARLHPHTRVVDVADAQTYVPSLVLVETPAASPEVAIVPNPSELLLWAWDTVPVWLVAGTGRVLPARLFDTLLTELRRRDAAVAVFDTARAAQVLGPDGPHSPGRLAQRVDCPAAPELLRL